jgi:GNAT superfamily N-acetyltransferase
VDSGLFAVRPFVVTDYEAEARLDAQTDPGFTRTAEEIRHWQEIENATPGLHRSQLVVEERRSGSVVAYGELANTSFHFHPQKYWIAAVVDPAFQGRGIGSELYATLEREAVARRAVCLWSSVRDDEAPAVRFFEHRGFRTLRKTWRSRLDLATYNPSALPDRSKELAEAGIRFTTLAAEGSGRSEVRRRAYELSRVASKDMPRLGEYTPLSFEQFVQLEIEAPDTLPEAFFIAVHGDRYVGHTTLTRELLRPDSLHVGVTGTHPDFRGRGIASELKRRAVEFARGRGAKYLVTYNDSLNRPIWAINEKLGFRTLVTWLMGEKALGPGGASL